MSGIPAWAYSGAKVVCTDGGTPGCHGLDLLGWVPITDEVYTISRVWCRIDGRVLCELVEQPRTLGVGGWGVVGHFRPLISQADDISTHFQQLLTTPVNVGEDA